ncbi:hypothetical protein RRG08_038233 [Elysia crispata]|uniref:Uncharacterized protein n=1 Tax=Elysia crispata TaxID=231223 RepID=A0AAE1E1Q8_9GAST|nr:hypothetical protein RRG08_038233 [Elysia crispata]
MLGAVRCPDQKLITNRFVLTDKKPHAFRRGVNLSKYCHRSEPVLQLDRRNIFSSGCCSVQSGDTVLLVLSVGTSSAVGDAQCNPASVLLVLPVGTSSAVGDTQCNPASQFCWCCL